MLITFKTLQQKTFKIEIDENLEVSQLKEKIAEERGDEFPVAGQKLIYSGKVLDDKKTIKEYNIDPVKNFVVVMAVKAKAKPTEKPADTSSSSTPAATTQATSSSEATTTSTPSAPTTQPTSTVSASESTPVSTTSTTTPAQPEVGGGILSGSALESSITELMSMGFPRDQVLRALQSSFHDANRAAEYLLSGTIPDIVEMEGGDDSSEALAADTNAPAAVGDLNFLRTLPQFRLLRENVRQNPGMLPQLLQEIGSANPQLLQLISQNQEAFITLLNEPEGGSEEGVGEQGGVGQQGGAQGGIQIQVTNDEKIIIDRIKAMGFAEADVVQAFFACEKNEALTINFLLNN